MTKPLHVLIVEDVSEDAELMALRLSEQGFPLDWRRVDNEPEYRKALETQPDLILADWTLPGFSGLSALQLMHGAGLDIPFIIISGNIGEEAAIDALHHGAYDYVFKDRPERLGNAVRHALEERQLREERRRSEETLRESEELYRQLFEAESDAVFLVDNETGRIIESNSAASLLYGYSRDELLSKKNSDLSAEPDDTRRVTQSTPPDPGRVITIPLRYHRKSDGTVFPVEITGRFFNRHERAVHIAAIRDITDRKRAEERLMQSEESARQLAQENAIMAEVARIVSSTLNIDEVYEGFAEEVKKVISFDRIVINLINTEKSTIRNVYISGEELRDRNTQDIYPLEGSGSAEMARTGSALLIQAEDFSEYEARFPMLLSTFQAGFRSILEVPLFLKGKIIGGLLLRSRKSYAYTDKDVRLAERIGSQIAGAIANAQLYAERILAEKEREALEEQLRQAQKMEAVGRLAGGVAHDFNNMLSVITGYTELAKDRVAPDGPLYRDLEEIWKAARRSTNLVRQLLAFARRQTVDPKVLDLNRLIGESENMLERMVGEDIHVRFVPAAELWAVRIDPSQIDQILANLATNARDAIRGVGAITMETANVVLDEDYCSDHRGFIPGEYVMIGFTDSGAGMSKETLDRIFEPFFTTKEVGKGTGLGLSTVYGVVKQNNGFINVYSEPGLGTTFKIYLPRYTGAIEGGKKEEHGHPSPGNETVLVVEDDPQILNLCRTALEKQGYAVLAANQPHKAIELSEKHQGHIHLLVTDVVMPAMNGKEMKGRIEKLRPGIKVLYMSGYTANVIAHRGVLSEGIHFIQKPFSIAALATKVREVLDQQ